MRNAAEYLVLCQSVLTGCGQTVVAFHIHVIVVMSHSCTIIHSESHQIPAHLKLILALLKEGLAQQ